MPFVFVSEAECADVDDCGAVLFEPLDQLVAPPPAERQRALGQKRQIRRQLHERPVQRVGAEVAAGPLGQPDVAGPGCAEDRRQVPAQIHQPHRAVPVLGRADGGHRRGGRRPLAALERPH